MKKLLFLSSLLISGLLSAQATYPLNENFDAAPTNGGTPSTGAVPTNWISTGGFKVYGMENLSASHGQSPLNACSVEMSAANLQDTLYTPSITPINANTKISISYRFVNKAGYPSTGYQLKGGDIVTIDANVGGAWQNAVATIDSLTNPTATSSYATYTYTSSNFATLVSFGFTTIQIRIDVARHAGDWYLDIDDFQVADVLTGISYNISNPPSLLVYPNPSHDNFSVWLKNYQPNNQVEVTVYNFLGQKVKAITTQGAVNNQISVNTAGLEKGMYLVEVKSGSEVAKTKVQID
ncbi:MAG TPA: T9SS type A sorting domain-containing protein [Bacteroidia bacterium]|nr:T9SS type A sorting domain-containing protein [Bacteroidia bacterium]